MEVYGDVVERNTTTGELYLTQYRNGVMLRINKKTYKKQEWFKTLEEAVVARDKCVQEMNEGSM
jgi:hypothetical protein